MMAETKRIGWVPFCHGQAYWYAVGTSRRLAIESFNRQNAHVVDCFKESTKNHGMRLIPIYADPKDLED